MRQISQKLRTFEEMTSKRGSCMGKAPCCPVSREQEIWIVLKLDAYSNITQLRRDLRIHYLMPNRKPLSQRYAFQRIVNKFKTTTYEEVKSKEKVVALNHSSRMISLEGCTKVFKAEKDGFFQNYFKNKAGEYADVLTIIINVLIYADEI